MALFPVFKMPAGICDAASTRGIQECDARDENLQRALLQISENLNDTAN